MARPSPSRMEWPPYWNREIETMPRDELQRLQDKKIRFIVEWAYRNSPFYHRLMEEAGVSPNDIRGLKDLPKLPMIKKEDIRKIQGAKPPFGDHIAAPSSFYYKICCSTGTTGRPTYNVWSPIEEAVARDVMCRTFWCMMMRPGDVYYNAWRMEFHYAWGVRFYESAAMMGMKVIPAGSTPLATAPDLVRRVISEVKPTVIGGTPSGMYNLGKKIVEEWGMDPPFEIVHTAGEPLVKDVRKKLMDVFNTEYVFDFYSFSELPTIVLVEDYEKHGGHWWHDVAAFEIVDPETGEQLGPGERGQLVVTSLVNLTMPIIRFNVEDIAYYTDEMFGCGRTHYVFPVGVMGREEWYVKVKGYDNEYHYILPWDVEAIVRNYPEIKDYQIVKYTPLGHDRLYVRLEPREEPADPDAWARMWEDRLSRELNVPVKVLYAEPGSMQPPIWKKEYVDHVWKKRKS